MGPWPPRAKGAGRPHPSSPSSFNPTWGSQGEGCPSSTYIYGCHVVIIIKPKIGENPKNPTTPPTTSPPLSYPWLQDEPRMRETSSQQHAVALPELRQDIYFRNLGRIGGTGSRRHTPYECEYSEVPLRHRTSRQDRHDLEVGFGSTTSSTFALEREMLSVYKRHVTGTVPLPHY